MASQNPSTFQYDVHTLDHDLTPTAATTYHRRESSPRLPSVPAPHFSTRALSGLMVHSGQVKMSPLYHTGTFQAQRVYVQIGQHSDESSGIRPRQIAALGAHAPSSKLQSSKDSLHLSRFGIGPLVQVPAMRGHHRRFIGSKCDSREKRDESSVLACATT
ncbi:uncharacterized protein PITG_10391 [Phytophthora infestans T30-4]|uniref:Uncharacterized protein n=1 Tax=Phytophthora infestans (strain T30-4) TaxID=403677 RepID=D0NF75_PHYIT|nr:uncharacterized protein PITG_10391 [Phytophthora infestans T30-4]EEY56864.1 hypothetical protein PITG_10391 [Phytophthora infestans T30-4]|eukprot:XP_002902192.1 hypothetical protein PITG_10391 [Phytophthora infestans T30-4]